MNATEATSAVKMGVTAMLVTFVIAAVMGLFYFIYGFLTNTSHEVSRAVSVSGAAKLYDLNDISNPTNLPLVTSAINAIVEGDSNALLYVAVVVVPKDFDMEGKTEDQINAEISALPVDYFTYRDITLKRPDGTTITPVYAGDTPVAELTRYLQMYASKRCIVSYQQGDPATGNDMFDWVQLTIYANL